MSVPSAPGPNVPFPPQEAETAAIKRLDRRKFAQTIDRLRWG